MSSTGPPLYPPIPGFSKIKNVHGFLLSNLGSVRSPLDAWVLKVNGNGTMVYGILHGTISDQTGGKLAAVTPSYYLFDLI